jgi:ribosomal protein S4E
MKQNTPCVEILIREYLKYSYFTVETKKIINQISSYVIFILFLHERIK